MWFFLFTVLVDGVTTMRSRAADTGSITPATLGSVYAGVIDFELLGRRGHESNILEVLVLLECVLRCVVRGAGHPSDASRKWDVWCRLGFGNCGRHRFWDGGARAGGCPEIRRQGPQSWCCGQAPVMFKFSSISAKRCNSVAKFSLCSLACGRTRRESASTAPQTPWVAPYGLTTGWKFGFAPDFAGCLTKWCVI